MRPFLGLVELLCLRHLLFESMGFAIDQLNPAPCLDTLPVPLLVQVDNNLAGTKTLTRLDPTAITERRSNYPQPTIKPGCCLDVPGGG
jgi:hypothetical protein